MAENNDSKNFIMACFCPEFAGDPPTAHKVGEPGCISSDQMPPDPCARMEHGDDARQLSVLWEKELNGGDPCGAEGQTGPNSWNQVTCDRPPHSRAWVHLAISDDVVDYIWRELHPKELEFLVLTAGDGLVCRFCAWTWTTLREHSSGCRLDPKNTGKEASPGVTSG
jgi:hypothetical protein